MSSSYETHKEIWWKQIAWTALSVPVAVLLFAIIVTLLFGPVGGGLEHMVFAYTDGHGSLRGEWVVFVGYVIAELLILELMRRTRYPGPWYLRATIVAIAAELCWLPFLRAPSISQAFRLQTIVLALFLLSVAFIASFVMTQGIARLRSSAHRTSLNFVLYVFAVTWAIRAAFVGALIWGVCVAIEGVLLGTGGSIAQSLFMLLFSSLMASVFAVLAILPYSVVFLLWLRLVRRYPALDATSVRRILAALVLALPTIAMIVCRGFGGLWDRNMMLMLLPLATLTCWGAVWIPYRYWRSSSMVSEVIE